jgi:Spy/CpxP family protein refolding chaperone
MNFKKTVLIAAAAALVCGAMAQGGGQGRGRGMFGMQGNALQLTGREDVQKDLALTDDEKAKLSELRDKAQQKRRDAFQAARDQAGDDREAMMKAMQTTMAKLAEEDAKDIAGILTADQNKRLKEIRVQFVGVSIVSQDKEIQKDLGITDDQKAKFTELQTKQGAAMRELFQSAQGDQAAMQEGMKKNQKIMEEEIGKILTADQKAKLKDMGGSKPFVRVDPPAGGGL